MNFTQNFSAKFSLSIFIALIFNNATAEQLAPPNAQLTDKFGVNVASGQVSTSLNTVSIGGAMGLSHSISTHANNFLMDVDSGAPTIGVSDAFSASAHYADLFLPNPSAIPTPTYTYKGVTYFTFKVMRVFDTGGSVDFVVLVNGVPTINYVTGPTYTYEVLNDANHKGDVRNTLEVVGNYLKWTKPDGTVVLFDHPAGTSAFYASPIYSITSPNGFQITVTRRTQDDIPVLSVNTNTGFQVMYVYTDDIRPVVTTKQTPDLVTTRQTSNSTNWSRYNPRYIYAINNAIEYCNPRPDVPQFPWQGETRGSLSPCTKQWSSAMFTWPAGMPRAFFSGDSVFSVTQTVNTNTPTAVTQYNISALDKAIAVVGGNPQTGTDFIPRLMSVKGAASTVPDVNYSYQNVARITCGNPYNACTADWYAKDAGRLEEAWGKFGPYVPISGAVSAYGYGIDEPLSQYPGDPRTLNNGAGINAYRVNGPSGGMLSASTNNGLIHFEVSPRNAPLYSIPTDAPRKDFFYDDNFRGNLTKITINSNAAETLEATYPGTCPNRKTCNQAMSIKDAKGNVTNYTYNLNSGQVETVTLPPNKRGIRAQTRYVYSPQTSHYLTATGPATGSIYLKTAESYCINSNYNGGGDGLGNFNGSCGLGDEVISKYEYNSNNLFLTAVTVTADNITKRTCYQYDVYGNRVGETSPLGATAGCPVSATQEAAPYTKGIRYNLAKQVTGTIDPDPDGTWALHYHATRSTYSDTNGLLIKLENGELASWHNELTPPSAWGDFTIYSSKTYAYDGYGRKTMETTFDMSGNTKGMTEYSYDEGNHVKCVAVRMTLSATGNACSSNNLSGSDPDRITQYTYDNRDQVLTEQRAVGTPIVQTYVSNTYVPISNYDNGYYAVALTGSRLASQTDANGNKTLLSYDDHLRLSSMIYPSTTKGSGQPNPADHVDFTYDLNNNIQTERKRNSASITYNYDANNRKTEKHILSDSTKDVYYDYDSRGLQLSALFGTAANSPGIATGYDGFGNVNLRWNSMLGTGRKLKFEYDLDNDRTRIYHADNQYFTYLFDGLDRMTVLFEGGGTRMLQIDYDPVGHRKLITRRNSVSTTGYNYPNGFQLDNFVQDFTGTANDLTNSFQYNNAGQISQLKLSNNLYNYSGNDNRTGTYTANGLNQYNDVGSQHLTYDLNANLMTDTGTAYNTSYTYDDENRLLTVSGTNNASFVYDPMGRLFQSTINGTKTQFLYDGDALIAEYDGTTGTMLKRYVHGNQVDEPLVQYNSATIGIANWIYLHADHQGNIIAESDVNGTVLSVNSYDAYGIPGTGNKDRFGYTGQIWFKELGLDYYKARWYSPKLGRFLQTDPIGYKDDYDLYSYAGNDPLNHTDPSGTNACGTNDDSTCHVTVNITDRVKDEHGNYTDNTGVTNQQNYNGKAEVSVNGVVVGTFLVKTTPSNTARSGTVANGTFTGSNQTYKTHGAAIAINNRQAVPTTGPNPNQGGRNVADGVFIHHAGKDNFTGTGSDGRPVSEGCQTIATSQWSEFQHATGLAPQDNSAPQGTFNVNLNTAENRAQ